MNAEISEAVDETADDEMALKASIGTHCLFKYKAALPEPAFDPAPAPGFFPDFSYTVYRYFGRTGVSFNYRFMRQVEEKEKKLT